MNANPNLGGRIVRSWQALSPIGLARRSVRGKVMGVVLLTTAIALLVAGTAMLTHDLGVYRQSWATDLATEAGILASSTTPALAFDDHDAADRALASLRARPEVQVAALYAANGELYAHYSRSANDLPPARAPAVPQLIAGERVEVTARLMQNGELLGTLFLRARYDVLGRIRAYAEIFAIVIALSMSVAIVLSSALQHIITAPLSTMAGVARQIVERRDYSLRARKSSDDEVGLLVDAFNSMLDEVQWRAHALEQSNSAMREEVATRQSAQAALAHANARLESTMAAAEIGTWVWDLRSGEFRADRNLAGLLGVIDEKQINGSPELWRRYVHPQDLPALVAAEQAAVGTGVLRYTEFRIVRADGVLRWMAGRGRSQLDDSGAPALLAGVMIDISRLKQTEDALREADRRKDEFLATLAHELRNPLAPIQHAVRILDTEASDSRQRQWARQVIARQTQRMALLLDDLLDVSRITSGRLDLKKDYLRLDALVATAIETARPLIDAKRHRLEVELPAAPLELEVDPLRLSQALSNLLTNAAKYTDPGGEIRLTAALHAQELHLSVKDNGIGISAQAISQVFEMFSQVESAIDRAEGGLGIGLALVRGLVALHGGTVQAVSAGLGRGSEFTIRLPREVVSARARAPECAQASASGATQVHCKVLVADDNHDAAQTLAFVLNLSGYEVCVAHSGQQALTIGARERPEVAILDIGMPDMTGYETARRMRQQEWGRNAFLIALSGWGQEEDKQKSKASGFDLHLTKPVDLSQLEQLLVAYLSRPGDALTRRAPAPGGAST